MKNKQKQTEYKTDNMVLASYLFSCLHMIKRVEPSPDIIGKYFFVFEQSLALVDLITQFHSQTAMVLPQNYYRAVREVKRMLIEYKNIE